MPKFAVFYVPEEGDALYRLGSQLVQYDVRNGVPAELEREVRARFATAEPFDPAWVALARPYGFHLTIGDAIDCSWDAIPRVERELEVLLRCFDPAHAFALQRHRDTPITVWGEAGQSIVVLPYTPNDYLVMLHTLVIARINPLGTGSGYLQQLLLSQPRDGHESPQAMQTRLFFSPTVLDHWSPHFTLLNPYSGRQLDAISHLLAELFTPFTTVSMTSLCLMVQASEDATWRICREFRRQ